MLLPHQWRLLRTAPADGLSNMALDLAMMDVAKRDAVGILRVYGWSEPTVSFGRNERVAGVYLPEELAQSGLSFVRRPTGGRALLHAREVTYSVAAPIGDDARWHAAYEAINEQLLVAMQSLGVPAHVVPRTSNSRELRDRAIASPTPSHDAGVVCFSGIAAGEIAVGSRKLVASSVWRERGAYLQHGSILLHDDQSLLSDLMGSRIAPPEPAATLAEWLTSHWPENAWVDAVESALNNAFGHYGKGEHWSIPTEVQKQVDVTRLALSESSWLWRR